MRLRAHLRAAALSAALALAAAAGGCQEQEAGHTPPPPPEVTVARPEQRPVTIYAHYTGTTRAHASVEVRARVAGALQEVHFSPGARVEEDDLLFVIEPAPYQAELHQAQAQLATARAKLKLAQATLTRKERAFRQRAVSEVEVIQARAEKAQAAAAIQAAQAQVESAEITLGYTRISSPLQGRASRSLVDAGNLVGAGQSTLLTVIVDDTPMYVYFSVPESHLEEYLDNRRPEGAPASGKGPPAGLGLGPGRDYPHQGRLDFMDNRVDPETGTIQVRGEFPNPHGKLLPGMFARVRVPLRQEDQALLVPDHALASDQGGRYLLVMGEGDVVERRPVEAGPLQDDGLRVISQGLKPDDRVIVKGLVKVRPGGKARPQEQGSRPAPASAGRSGS
jgi:RND family efflux transporter MFP subunit